MSRRIKIQRSIPNLVNDIQEEGALVLTTRANSNDYAITNRERICIRVKRVMDRFIYDSKESLYSHELMAIIPVLAINDQAMSKYSDSSCFQVYQENFTLLTKDNISVIKSYKAPFIATIDYLIDQYKGTNTSRILRYIKKMSE
jgi:hypothetical protein